MLAQCEYKIFVTRSYYLNKYTVAGKYSFYMWFIYVCSCFARTNRCSSYLTLMWLTPHGHSSMHLPEKVCIDIARYRPWGAHTTLYTIRELFERAETFGYWNFNSYTRVRSIMNCQQIMEMLTACLLEVYIYIYIVPFSLTFSYLLC